jgi:hypothetical protein
MQAAERVVPFPTSTPHPADLTWSPAGLGLRPGSRLQRQRPIDCRGPRVQAIDGLMRPMRDGARVRACTSKFMARSPPPAAIKRGSGSLGGLHHRLAASCRPIRAAAVTVTRSPSGYARFDTSSRVKYPTMGRQSSRPARDL